MYEIGDIVTLKKQHPCGGKTWLVVRVGAGVKLQCQTCGKYVNVMRDDLKKRMKSIEKTNDQGANE